MTQYLLLKWGSLKGWNGIEDGTKTRAALERYHADPVSMSAAMQRDTDAQRQALFDAIDAVYEEGGEAHNDWDGTTYATADDAKAYVMNYDKPKPPVMP
jgi:hypothetical protein